jgi:hypothetical protein
MPSRSASDNAWAELAGTESLTVFELGTKESRSGISSSSFSTIISRARGTRFSNFVAMGGGPGTEYLGPSFCKAFIATEPLS